MTTVGGDVGAAVEAAGDVAGGTVMLGTVMLGTAEMLGAGEVLGDTDGVTEADGLEVMEAEALGEGVADEICGVERATGLPPPPQAVRPNRPATASAAERRAGCDRELGR